MLFTLSRVAENGSSFILDILIHSRADKFEIAVIVPSGR